MALNRTQETEEAAQEVNARALLKEAISRSGKTYEQLAQDLSLMGVIIQARPLNNKVNRGSFTAAFLLQCLTALGVDQDGLLNKINNEVESVRRTKT